MNGPTHYRTGEEILRQADQRALVVARRVESGSMEPEAVGPIATLLAVMVEQAKAHFAAAQVAATIEVTASRGPGDVEQSWIDATR